MPFDPTHILTYYLTFCLTYYEMLSGILSDHSDILSDTVFGSGEPQRAGKLAIEWLCLGVRVRVRLSGMFC